MSDAPKRTLQMVHQEYSSLCAQLGHLTFNIKMQENDVSLIFDQIRTLNQEAMTLAAAEKATASTPASTPVAEGASS